MMPLPATGNGERTPAALAPHNRVSRSRCAPGPSPLYARGPERAPGAGAGRAVRIIRSGEPRAEPARRRCRPGPRSPSRMPSPDIDTAYIERLAELLQRTGLTEIEVCQGETRIRVAKQHPPAVEYTVPPAAPGAHAGLAPAAAPPAAAQASEAPHPGAITSPMVGTVYLAPEPTAPAVISSGDMVKEGQTLLIIEAMKVMNAIRAPRAGRVLRIFVESSAPVEYGEPLLVLE